MFHSMLCENPVNMINLQAFRMFLNFILLISKQDSRLLAGVLFWSSDSFNVKWPVSSFCKCYHLALPVEHNILLDSNSQRIQA